MVIQNGIVNGFLRVIGTLFCRKLETEELNGITKTELNYLGGVTSNVQTQLNGRATAAQGTKADNALPRSGGTITGDITPDTNSTRSLGSSSSKWKNIYATTLNGSLNGNASSATKLSTPRTFSLTGAVTGSGAFDGSGNLSLATTLSSVPSPYQFISNIALSPADFINLSARIDNALITSDSIAEIYFNGETRPTAAKAGISVNTYNGYLTLTAVKKPSGQLVIETITLLRKQ